MTQTISFPVQNMTCGGCASRVKKALGSVDGILDAEVNLAAQSAQIAWNGDDPRLGALQALRSAGYPAKQEALRLSVAGMSCAACAARLTQTLEGAPGVSDVRVNLADDTADLRYVPGLITPSEVQQIAAQAGYPAETMTTISSGAAEERAQLDSARHRMIVAAVLTLPVFALEMGGHLIPAWHHAIGRTIGHEASWLIQFVLTTLVLIGPGRGFFSTGIPALLRRAPTMNSLVALGAGAAWSFSTIALFAPALLPDGTRAVYFEAAAVIVTLILTGRWFEVRAKGQVGTAVRELIGLQPRSALVQRDGTFQEVAIDALKVGDVILLRPGARVPTDAEVISGSSHVDESMLTGEPLPVPKTAGDTLTGGSVNGAGPLTCAVRRVGEDTTLSQIIRMVQQAQGARLPIQALVDQVTLWFVPAVMVTAVVTVLCWLAFGPDPALSFALVAGVSVLIIACPCAMGLATPTSVMAGTGRAARLGVLFRQGDALQQLSALRVIAFDKTGTLTEGKPTLSTFVPAPGLPEDDVLCQIAAVEQHSEHPLAEAVRAALTARDLTAPEASAIEVVPGAGIIGTVGKARVVIGNAALMAREGIDIAAFGEQPQTAMQAGQIVFFAGIDGAPAAMLGLSDPIRPTARRAVQALQARGLEVAMISGDGRTTAEAVAKSLGIATVFAEQTPEDKMQALRDLRAKLGAIGFVGDGINDAPVLAEADVGLAIGTGTDVAIETADVVLTRGDPLAVIQALRLSQLTLRNIKQNLVWAFGYNTLLIPVAAGLLYPAFGLLLSPGLAAGAMAFSSVFVLGNALRLRRVEVDA